MATEAERREAQIAINEALKNQNNLTNQYATLLSYDCLF